ncbi:MAG: hypothetical protein ACAH79_07780 [Thermoleophilia bacterium]
MTPRRALTQNELVVGGGRRDPLRRAAAAAQRLTALIAGGQRVNRLLGPRAGRAVVPGVDGRRVALSVTAVARDGHAGGPARASLAAARRLR